MPIPVFAMLVFAICTWLGAGVVEALMTDFATEAGISVWSFVAVPGLFAMLFAFVFYRHAESRITGVEQSTSRALAVAVATWIAIAILVGSLWCPGYRALGCTMDVLLVTGVVGGGPLLLACLIAGLIVGLVLKRRVSWLAYKPAGTPSP
jgi:hypothetical protein